MTCQSRDTHVFFGVPSFFFQVPVAGQAGPRANEFCCYHARVTLFIAPPGVIETRLLVSLPLLTTPIIISIQMTLVFSCGAEVWIYLVSLGPIVMIIRTRSLGMLTP